MNITVKTTNLAYHHSLGKRIPEDLVFVTKMKVDVGGSNVQSKTSQYRRKRELTTTVKC